MKKTIKILPINIPGKEIPLILEAMDNDLFYLKVKKKVAGNLICILLRIFKGI